MLEVLARLFDPEALVLVGAGSIAAAALRSTRQDLWLAARALRPMFRAAPAREEQAARLAVRQIEGIAKRKGIACADHVGAESPFVRRAGIRLADASSVESFSAWGRGELADRKRRHEVAAAVWRAAADASPNMGMIGTVIGLIGMFASIDDPAAMGPAMALAMLTTLYGLLLGGLLFGPAAARLARLSEAELGWQEAVLKRLEQLAAVELEQRCWFRQREQAGT